MLELIKISKSYGPQLILNNISLCIEENNLVSILGPSGSGKSTLLQIIGMLNPPDSGTISLNQITYDSIKPNELSQFRNINLGFVFQFHNLLGEFTSEENIKMPLLIREPKLQEKDLEFFEMIIKKLGIENLMKKLPSQLSGGEQQRVAVARALINKPKLLLADEPTGNLDNKNASNLYELFLELKSDWKQTIIMVTHNESLTKKSDKIIHLNSGSIV